MNVRNKQMKGIKREGLEVGVVQLSFFSFRLVKRIKVGCAAALS